MAFPYTKYRPDWVDDDPTKPADAAAFDHIEAGIKDMSDVVIPDTLFDAKGDLIVASAADTPIRVAVGTDDMALAAASGAAGGVAWKKVDNAMVAVGAGIVQSKLAFDAFQSYTPVLTATTTNPTLGSGSVQVGEYFQIGKLVVGRAVIVFGGAGQAPGSGTYRISVPVTANAAGPKVGSGDILDNSANLIRLIGAELATTTEFQLRIDNSGLGLVTDAVPWVWAPNDQISFFFVYRAA